MAAQVRARLTAPFRSAAGVVDRVEVDVRPREVPSSDPERIREFEAIYRVKVR